LQSLQNILKQRTPEVVFTKLLIAANILIFFAMLKSGTGLWKSENGIQLSWGANFGPATQDGEWWRLASAIFLHFSIIHLAINMWSLWDAGQFVERMYGHTRFICIYLLSGILGNLTSLVVQGNSAVSGGASSSIFGIIGALLVYLWANRETVSLREFRLFFWGALGFSIAIIVLGFIIPGIDNSAHIGGFISGILLSIILLPSIAHKSMQKSYSIMAAITLSISTVTLIYAIPAPQYKWVDEIYLRKQIDEFLMQDQAINRSWLDILQASKDENSTFNSLASKIDNNIVEPYEESFEKLSRLPENPALPSAAKLANLLKYTQERKNESKALADKLRTQDKTTRQVKE
jgi:rhomboid protease GluP